MREIKFRIYNPLHKVMSKVEKIDFSNYNIFATTDLYTAEMISNGNESPALMQFTGLIDKNGKEIYEGDILEVHFWDNQAIAVVYYDVRKASYRLKFVTYPCMRGNKMLNFRLSKVIGNIYENPELLK